MNLFAYLNKQRRFSTGAFPKATWISALRHLEKELIEVRESDGKDVMEWANPCVDGEEQSS